MSKHTPGPWNYDKCENFIIKEDIQDIATMCGDADKERLRANAKLIAAAPELLEALEACLYLLDDYSGTNEADDIIVRAQELVQRLT